MQSSSAVVVFAGRGTFWIFYPATNAEALDKVNAALRATMKANTLAGSAFAPP